MSAASGSSVISHHLNIRRHLSRRLLRAFAAGLSAPTIDSINHIQETLASSNWESFLHQCRRLCSAAYGNTTVKTKVNCSGLTCWVKENVCYIIERHALTLQFIIILSILFCLCGATSMQNLKGSLLSNSSTAVSFSWQVRGTCFS